MSAYRGGPRVSSIGSPGPLRATSPSPNDVSNGSNGNAGAASSSNSSSTSVKVAVRVRPLNPHDAATIPPRWQRSVLAPISSNSVQVEASSGPPPSGDAAGPPAAGAAHKRQQFTYDRVLGPHEGQEDVYAAVQPMVSRFLEGFNVTVLAYGQTSSGKSYTMGTSAADVDFESLVAGRRPDPQVGIIPRAVAEVFTQMKQMQARNNGVQFTAKVSFIEIYNEELIDLLNETEGDMRPLVQIREDKAGHILWSGLREPKVQGVTDVMNLLLQGSSIRRTNETDMNAQSSRSHAIFSLTLTQQKFVGSGPAPPPSAFNVGGAGSASGRTTPGAGGRTTPTGRPSMSGLPRPTSMLPQPRSHTPSALSGRASSASLRPASVQGRSASPAVGASGNASSNVFSTTDTTQDGDWVTITSKFHFVDLAGSERLKRTAALGERAKEGISINAGLHALGNVISALGDPVKAKRTTHIPYRDSKLTRLLQDSLGGNAVTMMIACVAPTEYNVGETINTLQYANRARNIKNKAERNEVEVGWDDVEHLRATVLRLRKQVAVLRGFKGGEADAASLQAMDSEILQWQGKYTEASQRVSQLTADLTKLQQATKGKKAAGDDDADFLAAAEPIIVEYEKTLDALEGRLNLMKAALSHSEDIINEQEGRISDQEERMLNAEQQLESRESTIVELQARLAKVQDRESTAEGYARDLETRLQTLDSKGDSASEQSAELRREVSRLREAEGKQEIYIKELEDRLAKADASSATLAAQVERLEHDVQRRDEAYKELQERLEMLDNGDQTKALVEDYQRSEQSNLELRAQLEELKDERDAAVKERGKLHDAAAAHELHRGDLEDRIRELEAKSVPASSTDDSSTSRDAALGAAGGIVAGAGAGALAATAHNGSNGTDDALQAELESLRRQVEASRNEEMQAKAQVEAINAKYQETLTEMHTLNLQLSEAKLMGGSTGMTPKLKNAEFGTEPEEELEELANTSSPSTSKRGSLQMTRRMSGQLTSPVRNVGERERTSSNADEQRRLQRRSSGSFFGYNPQQGGLDSPSRRERPRSLSQQSLSQELLPALSGGHRPLSLSTSVGVPALSTPSQAPAPGATTSSNAAGDSSLLSPSRSSTAIARSLSAGPSTPTTPTASSDRNKINMLEKGILSLQEALKKRDAEIAQLEATFRENSNNSQTLRAPLANINTAAPTPASERDEFIDAVSPSTSQSHLSVYDTPGPPTPSGDATLTAASPLTPLSEGEFETVKQLIAESQAQHGGDVDGNYASRLDSLIRSMARKEQGHRERSESLAAHLQAEQAQREAAEKRAQELAREIEELHSRSKSTDREPGLSTPKASTRASAADQELVTEELQQLRRDLESVRGELTQREKAFEIQLQSVRNEQAEALTRAGDKGDSDKDRQHSEALARLVAEHQAATAQAMEEHQASIDALIAGHSKNMESRDASHATAKGKLDEANAALEALRNDHAATLEAIQGEHARKTASLLAEKDEAHQVLVDSYESRLAELGQHHDDELVRLHDEHESTLSNHKTEAAAALASATAAAAATAAVNTSGEDDEVEQLKNTHEKAISELQSRLDADRQQALADAHAAYTNEKQRVADEHEARIADLQRQHTQSMDQVTKRLSTFRDVHGEMVDVDALRLDLSETSDALVTLEDALTSVTSERDELAAQVQKLEAAHNSDARAEAESLRRELENHKLSVANLKTELLRAKSEIQQLSEERIDGGRTSRDGHVETGGNAGHFPSSMGGTINGGSFRGSKGALPPPTPPPSMPVPPTPSGQRASLGARASLSSLMTRSDSPDQARSSGTTSGGGHGGPSLSRSSSATSMYTQTNSINGMTNSDAKKLLAEQSEELKSLAKQLAHCEADLQANIDLVSTLEAALNDSERNLRKSRVQLTEVGRERDRYSSQADDLRQQLQAAQKEVDSVRNSVILEKQEFEQKISKLHKEKAAKELEARMEEMNRRKSSRFLCM
ncbi:kinesin-domain-containing protein [Jaminaea rosea]|uniref:Kinesin-domain-containing protein n=1 Tax=Jaminaea rosea TaxID=1569628 RepID=A0A316UXF5_9BASI|nr:kinesin-domain-containing protein [Jaminaea rosea]PWN29997.1 kinesin-domain-containing protein [Jaminaea rosea]